MEPDTIPPRDLEYLFEEAKKMLAKKPFLTDLDWQRATVVGDIHGCWETYTRALSAACEKIVFLGDVVDRGKHSIEVFASILGRMLEDQNEETILLRGNHETWEINMVWGFRTEMLRKYGEKSEELWEEANSVMDLLPVVAILQGRIMAVHGGIGSRVSSLGMLRTMNKGLSPPVMDLLWNDPGGEKQKRPYEPNEYRGRGEVFSPETAEKFCLENGLDFIVRGHQCVTDGYKWTLNKRVLTVFPIPNYENRWNKAAVCHLDGGKAVLEVIGG